MGHRTYASGVYRIITYRYLALGILYHIPSGVRGEVNGVVGLSNVPSAC